MLSQEFERDFDQIQQIGIRGIGRMVALAWIEHPNLPFDLLAFYHNEMLDLKFFSRVALLENPEGDRAIRVPTVYTSVRGTPATLILDEMIEDVDISDLVCSQSIAKELQQSPNSTTFYEQDGYRVIGMQRRTWNVFTSQLSSHYE